MNPVQLNALRNFMKQSSYTFTDEWLEACLSWIKENHNQGQLSLDFIKNQLFEQWKDANLEEMESKSLPPNLANESNKVITGVHGLQINSIQDIGESNYSQWNRIKKLENENVSVEATDSTAVKQTWEPKQKRCFYLTMTDGSQTVFGLELVQLPQITISLAPGTKILIKGPVTCRRGVFELNPETIKILGGEVDSLSTNRFDMIIARNLDLPAPALTDIPSQATQNSQKLMTDSISTSNRTTQFIGIRSQNQNVPDSVEDVFGEDDDDFFMDIDETALIDSSIKAESLSKSVPVNVVQIPTTTSRPPESMHNQPVTRTNQASFVNSGRPVQTSFPSNASSTSANIKTISAVSSFKQTSNKIPTTSKQASISKYLVPKDSKVIKLTEDQEIIDLSTDDEEDYIPKNSTREATTKKESEEINTDELFADNSDNPYVDLAIEETMNSLIELDSPPASDPLTKIRAEIPKEPYQYLIDIKPDFRGVVKVKACVLTLASKCQADEKNEWSLFVVLADGSGTLKTKICPKFLERLIGFSTVNYKSAMTSKVSSQKEQAKKGLINLTEKLVQLNEIVEIRVIPGFDPLITNFFPLTSQHITQLNNRLLVCC